MPTPAATAISQKLPIHRYRLERNAVGYRDKLHRFSANGIGAVRRWILIVDILSSSHSEFTHKCRSQGRCKTYCIKIGTLHRLSIESVRPAPLDRLS